ncbi:MAG: glutamine-hydrolyzing carbamoyl-phosphate synthase small subunit [Opitutales bacterium]|nr:glutamine-hydrolyzing carbamoyl-phosphate synthase small subunit [Opitutales bacterium]
MDEEQSGILALEDGTVFRGRAFGARKTVLGEAVFNTSMTGYQEILTDPSYFGQIVTMTAPQIGNYGVNPEDAESDGPKVAGFVVRELSPIVSNWRSRQDLGSYLADHGIPGLEGIDTRSLTKRLRVGGAMKACLSTEDLSDEEAIRRAREWTGLVGQDYVREVTCKSAYEFKPGVYDGPFGVPGTELTYGPAADERPRFRLVALDLGLKYNILRRLHAHGFDITVVPADTTAEAIRALKPQALFLSNGPGDPSAVHYAHTTVAELLESYPTFGICMGHQIISHALGADTVKLKFGHRGGNQPVKNTENGFVAITAQNHGFASTREALEGCGAVITEVNLNDNTVAGLRHATLPVFSVQYHPEASPGPHDSDVLFEQFYQMVARQVAGEA